MSSNKVVSLWCALACVVGGLQLAQAEEAAEEGTEAPAQATPETASPEATPPAEAQESAAPAAEQTGQAPRAPAASDEMVRFGRVEMVLIENEDAESAIEFGQELLTQDGDTAQIRLLLAACYMTMNRPTEALEHLRRAVQLSENNPVLQLHALYNIARALHAAGQLREAADAYEQYVTFARTHGSLTSFADEAQRIARVLRGRVESTR